MSSISGRASAGPPIVMLHGASSNLEVMRRPLAERLAQTHRVILIDRPGHGWSTRASFSRFDAAAAGPHDRGGAGKARHWTGDLRRAFLAGALALRIALDYPDRVAGLVMLAPVAYPWPGGVSQYNYVVTTPVIGPLLAHTVTLPLGLMLADPGSRSVFAPQAMPDEFCQKDSATRLLLRPREFIANAWDLVTLNAGDGRAGAALRQRSPCRSRSSPAMPTRRCRPISIRSRWPGPRRTRN